MKARRLAVAPRDVVVVVTSLVVTAAILLFGLGERTPAAIVFRGGIFGLLNALTAAGLVLVYRSHRIINFAQAALGVGGGVFTFNLTTLAGWPFLVAAVAGVLVAAGLALVFQLAFVVRFFNAPRLALTVLTIAAIPAIEFSAGFVTALPIFPDVADRTLEELLGQGIRLPFESFSFTIGGFALRFGFAHLLALGASVAALAGLGAFFRFSRTGVAVRAAAENPDRASLLGISLTKLSMIVWVIAGALSGLGVILHGAVQRQFSPGAVPPELIIIPLAAAVLARFSSFPLVVFFAVLLTVVRGATQFTQEAHLPLVDVGLLVVVLGGLLLQIPRRQRSEEAEATAFESAKEHRPIPKEMLERPSIRGTRRALVGLGAIGLIVFPLAATPAQTNLAGFLILVGIAILSLVVLTGWAGQVSLGQFGLVALGAVIGGALTSRVGISFWLTIVAVPFFVAGLTALMGLPALRVRGLFLAVVTFAFAIAVESVLFREEYFSWLLPGAVDRPTLFLLDFEDNRSMYYLNLVALGLSVAFVVGLRRSRVGRILIASRENENNLRSFGVSVLRARLTAFTLAGFLCGLAGVLIAHHQRAVTAADFPTQMSLDVFLYAVVGGVGSVGGALLGTLYLSLTRLVTNDLAFLLVGPVALLAILYISPGGLVAIYTSLRDGILRIVAQRRQMIVPALYADVDPAALERRLIPLAESIPNTGLDALPYDRRYDAASHLYGSRGMPRADGDGRRDLDRVALGGAAERVSEIGDAPPGGDER